MNQNHWHCVENTEATQALLNPEMLRIFAVFFDEQSLSSAAKILQQPASSLKYHLEKFIAWGLVTQTRSQPRKGKPIKYFQAVSGQFFIPFANTSHETLTQMMRFMQIPLFEQYLADFVRAGAKIQPRASQGGMCLRTLAFGRYSIDFSTTPPPNIEIEQNNIKPLWNSWTTIHLSFAQAEALRQELQQLWSRVCKEHSQAKENTQAYTLHLGFTPQS